MKHFFLLPILRHSGMICFYRNMRPKHNPQKCTSLNPNVANLLFSQHHKYIGGQGAHSY